MTISAIFSSGNRSKGHVNRSSSESRTDDSSSALIGQTSIDFWAWPPLNWLICCVIICVGDCVCCVCSLPSLSALLSCPIAMETLLPLPDMAASASPPTPTPTSSPSYPSTHTPLSSVTYQTELAINMYAMTIHLNESIEMHASIFSVGHLIFTLCCIASVEKQIRIIWRESAMSQFFKMDFDF